MGRRVASHLLLLEVVVGVVDPEVAADTQKKYSFERARMCMCMHVAAA